jgi:Phosphatidylinositol 3- and 4-kinase
MHGYFTAHPFSPTHIMPAKQSFEPQEVIQGGDFAFRANLEMAATQANETFLVDAKKNRCIGDNGEALGFAKKQFSDDKALQALRDRKYERADAAKKKLGEKHPEAVKWLDDRNMLEKLDEPITAAGKAVVRNQEVLASQRRAEVPDMEAIANTEADLAKSTKALQLFQAIKANPALERARLAEVARMNPVVMEYARLNDELKAASNLTQSITNVTISSGNLYENQNEIQSDASLGGDRDLLTRAVASHEVDKLLDLNVCAQEKFGLDDKGQVFGISVQCDGVNVRSEAGYTELGEKVTAFLDIDYSNAVVQKGIHDLEALDYITGQFDRHPGNIFVDPDTGTVTGIDNDLAFPEVDREEMLRRNEELGPKAVAGMPKMMHQQTADKIAAINPEALRAKLASVRPPNGGACLGEKEIDGAVKRLKDLQTAIKNKEGIEVVPAFDRSTYNRCVHHQVQSSVGQNKPAAQSYIGAIYKEVEPSRAVYAAGSVTTVPRDLKSIAKAKIAPEYAAFKQMDSNRQADYRELQSQLEKLNDRLKDTSKQRAKLEAPTMKDRLKALRHGGVEATKKHLDYKADGLAADIKRVESRIDGMLAQPQVKVEAPLQQEEPKSKQKVGEVLKAKREAKGQSADALSAEDTKVGAKVAKRPQLNMGSTNSSSVRH